MIQGKISSILEFYLRNRSALAVNCCIIIHCLDVSCKEDQIMSVQQETSLFVGILVFMSSWKFLVQLS